MADITASAVKELRERTGAGMMDAKKALVETNGDMEAAVDLLRTKGLAKAAKKSGRTAAEGLISLSLSSDCKSGVLVEVNSETDFVARNGQFQEFCAAVGQLGHGVATIEELSVTQYGNGKTVTEQLTENIATIGENMSMRRIGKLTVSQGAVAGYMHNATATNMGKIGVLVAIEGPGDAAKLQELGKKIAMHIAAANPEFLCIADVSADALEREKAVLREQAMASGKPADVVEKMMEGRIRKFYEEVVLLEQIFIMDGETKIAKLIEKEAPGCTLAGYLRFMVGEGIEKEESDFAAEVAKMTGTA